MSDMSLHQAEDETCSGKYWDLPRDLLHIGDHMDRFESGEMSSTKRHKFLVDSPQDYMDQQTGSPGCQVGPRCSEVRSIQVRLRHSSISFAVFCLAHFGPICRHCVMSMVVLRVPWRFQRLRFEC